MSSLKPGDIVHLKSGGPGMTLETLSKGERIIARCTWFDGHQKHSENFVVTSLNLHKTVQATPAQPKSIDANPVQSIVGLVTKNPAF